MKKVFSKIVFMLVIAGISFSSCRKEKSCEGCITGNKLPIAIAGPDQLITLPTDSVSLDGSASNDPDGTISTWLWKKLSGPVSANIVNATTARTAVRDLDTGVYRFELTVKDNAGLQSKDTMQVTVSKPGPINRPPVANAGSDQTITLPVNSANLNGSASSDPDNNIVSYQWTKIEGPASFTISNANAVQTPVTNLVEGTYKFELKVTDAGGLFAKDTVQIIVAPSTIPNSNNLYIAGWGTNARGKKVARIWNNNIVQDLTDGQHDAEATSVFVSGSDVYVAGHENNASGNGVAKLWKNGVVQNLNNGQGISQANSVFVSGNDVYVAGSILNAGGSGDAILWKNGVVQNLSNGQNGMSASVYVVNNDVYVAGFRDACMFGGCPEAILWKNGVAQSLLNTSQYSGALSVFVSGSDVYVAGHDGDSAKLWKNGVVQKFSGDSHLFSVAQSVFISGSDVYMAGTRIPCAVGGCSDAILWKNGQPQILQLVDAGAPSVYVSGSDVYVAGYDGGSAKLWKNGIVYAIQGLKIANSVFVK